MSLPSTTGKRCETGFHLAWGTAGIAKLESAPASQTIRIDPLPRSRTVGHGVMLRIIGSGSRAAGSASPEQIDCGGSEPVPWNSQPKCRPLDHRGAYMHPPLRGRPFHRTIPIRDREDRSYELGNPVILQTG